ncbi:MAG: UPF0175 family protein [Acidobacteria bacterium]|nr:UPF0175 family protein [Acidobacteriota bacterium]
MDLTIHIPDELAGDLAAAGGDLARRALEGFALEEYKSGRLSKAALRRLLGFSTRDQLNGFLKAHAVLDDLPTMADLEGEMQDLRSLGL